ncbi:MAG: hypothetical protein ABFS86_16610 [Planctomycetota bacterium]
MARSSLMVVILAVFAGAAAGMAVQLFDAETPATGPGPATGGVSEAEHSEVENLVHRGSDRIRDAEIEIERLRSEIASLQDQLTAQADEFEAFAKASGERGPDDFTVIGPDGEPVKMRGATRLPVMRLGGGKGFKLAGLPEEEKWAKLREELALDSYQESELKQIAVDYRKAMSDMFKTENTGGGTVSFGKIDLGKIMKARTDADERVKNLLSEQQHEKFKKENYGAAIGLGGATSVSVSTTFDSSEGK